jgi:hypothetical protein
VGCFVERILGWREAELGSFAERSPKFRHRTSFFHHALTKYTWVINISQRYIPGASERCEESISLSSIEKRV